MATSLTVTVRTVGGEVLVGPNAALDEETVAGDLKRRCLRARGDSPGGKAAGLQLLTAEGRELPDQEAIAAAGAPGPAVELTAVLLDGVVAELKALAVAATEREARLKQASDRWMGELRSADEQRKRQQRDADISEYRRAVAELVTQLVEEALSECRGVARWNGEREAVYDFQMRLQRCPLSAKITSLRPPVLSDPQMRGWYFAHQAGPDELVAPASVRMGDESETRFYLELQSRIIEELKGLGLHAEPGECYHMVTISWGEQPAPPQEDDGPVLRLPAGRQ